MPPSLASFLTVAFVVFLFRRDFREKSDVTSALWIPLFWMLIIGSRAVTEWLDLFGLHLGGVALEEGSPLDASVYYGLIAAGLYILNKRQANLAEFFRNNRWIAVFLLYCLVAVVWSDFPFSAFKRWTKVIGHPIMVLVILTEPDPDEAFIVLMKRCAYVLLPVSILFIKYYPQWGRGFSEWTGQGYSIGVTGNKNLLGCDCLVLGLFFFWHWLQTWRSPRDKTRRNELLLTAGLIYMVWWLLSAADSSTSFMSLLLGALTMLLLGARFINRKIIGTYIVITVLAIVAVESTFSVYDYMLTFLHRDSTLTERTFLWDSLFKVRVNPIIGTGFESFWLGERREKLWLENPWRPSEAHNGYLETYLNIGLMGLFMLIGLIIATFRKGRSELLSNFQRGRLRLGFLIAIVVYNWTEATFKGLSFLYFAFYLVALDYPRTRSSTAESFTEASESEENTELAYGRQA
jgi:O-antigen ligase